MGKIVLDDTRSEIRTQSSQGILVSAHEGVWAGKGYTTQEMVELERENLALMEAGQGKAQPLVAAQRVNTWAQRKQLFPDQTTVVRQTLTSRHWLSAIE